MQDQCSVIWQVVYVQQSISALIALSHVKKGAKYLGGPPLAFFFPNFRLKKNCSKDTLKMLHLCKCHETNVVDLWPLEGRDGWVCPVNLTDRERSEDGQAASLVLPLGGPSSLFCGLISYFFPQKSTQAFLLSPKKLTSSLDPWLKWCLLSINLLLGLRKIHTFSVQPKIPLEL